MTSKIIYLEQARLSLESKGDIQSDDIMIMVICFEELRSIKSMQQGLLQWVILDCMYASLFRVR